MSHEKQILSSYGAAKVISDPLSLDFSIHDGFAARPSTPRHSLKGQQLFIMPPFKIQCFSHSIHRVQKQRSELEKSRTEESMLFLPSHFNNQTKYTSRV